MSVAPLLAGAVLGPALQVQQAQLWAGHQYLWLGMAGLATLLAARATLGARRGCLLLLGMALLAGGAAGWRAERQAREALAPALEGRDLQLVGRVAALPQRNEAGLRFRFEVESASLGTEAVTLPPRLLLGWYGGAEATGQGSLDLQRQPADLRAGERWQITARLKAPHGHLNPHGFDYELWLWEQGVGATGYVRAGPRDAPPRRLGVSWRHPVEAARQSVRDAIFAQVADPRLAGVLAALVVGDQAAIERADWDVFRATGVAHLMSISGLHVTMFAWAAALALGWAWRRSPRLCLAWPAQHAALAGGVVLAAAYALFSGWGVPAQRTVWMLAAAACLRLGARRWPWPHAWGAAAAAVVTIDPWALLQPGFWLSFVAVGVLFASGPADRTPPATPAPRTQRVVAVLGGLLREQWIVTVALTPLSLLLFGQVSLVGLAANLLAIPWVTLVVTPLGLAGVLLAPLWTVAAWALAALSWGLQALASLPGAIWSAPAPPLWAGAAGVLGGLLLAMRLPWALRVFGVPLLLPVLLWQAPRPPPGTFELLAADVGQGNAVLVRTAEHTLVYDAGPITSRDTDAGQRVLVPLLRAWDERVDRLVLSHRDSDHTGGAAAVLRMQPQADVLASLEADHPLRGQRAVKRCAAGQRWHWDGVDFEILHPRADDYAARLKPNAMSCVLRVAAPGGVALLTGDIERPQEEALLARGAGLRADWLLVPHHGSKTSSSPVWLATIQPGIAFVQAGYRNRFGHPAPDVVARYQAQGIRLLASPGCGAAAWRSDQPHALTCQREAARRYWHHR